MKREEIEEKYKWDLTIAYKTNEDFMKDFNYVKEELPNVAKYKEKFLETSDTFIEFMELIEKIDRRIDKMYSYASESVDVEPNNAEVQDLNSKIKGLEEAYRNETVFIDLEILKNEDKARKILFHFCMLLLGL